MVNNQLKEANLKVSQLNMHLRDKLEVESPMVSRYKSSTAALETRIIWLEEQLDFEALRQPR